MQTAGGREKRKVQELGGSEDVETPIPVWSLGLSARRDGGPKDARGCTQHPTLFRALYGVSQLGKQCSFDYPEVKCINRGNTARRAKRRVVVSRNLNSHSTDDEEESFPPKASQVGDQITERRGEGIGRC